MAINDRMITHFCRPAGWDCTQKGPHGVLLKFTRMIENDAVPKKLTTLGHGYVAPSRSELFLSPTVHA
jgi:hypothetical protein